jgi:hypothetical protein
VVVVICGGFALPDKFQTKLPVSFVAAVGSRIVEIMTYTTGSAKRANRSTKLVDALTVKYLWKVDGNVTAVKSETVWIPVFAPGECPDPIET